MNLTGKAIQRPVTSLMIFTCFIVIGLISGSLVPLEFFPDISYPGMYVHIPYAGSTPEEIERLITRPVEEALATLSDIELMDSNSRENEGGVFVRFKMGTDVNLKAIEGQEKIDGIWHLLPADLERIHIFKFSATDEPILNLRISSDRDLSNSYDLLYRNLKQRIERIDGVSKVDLYGVEKKQLRIEIKPDRLVNHNVDLGKVVQDLSRSNFSTTAGQINESGHRYIVRSMGQLTKPEEYANLIIGPNHLRLKDIADVSFKNPDVTYGRHLDQKYAIGLDVFKESGANTVGVSRAVLKEVEAIKDNPAMKGIRIFEMNNQASGIISSLKELFNAGILGGMLSIIVLFFFLRNIPGTMIVALAVPFSLIVTVAVLYFLHMSLNILTMMGLMLAIGMLVDNAVVVTENIHRQQAQGKDRKAVTVQAVKEVAMAVTAGTITTIIVFLPNIVSQQDMWAVYLKHVAVTICTALLASLLISLSIIPLLYLKYEPKIIRTKPTIIDKATDVYSRILDWIIHHKKTAVLSILLILVSVMIPMKFVKTDMFPNTEGRTLRLFYNIRGHYVLEKVEESVSRIEKYLYDHQKEFEIRSVYSYYETGWAISTIMLTEEDKAQKSVEEIKEAIRKELPKISLGTPTFEYRSMRGDEALRVHLIGESSDILNELAQEAVRRIKKIPGFADVRSEAESGTQEVQLRIDRERSRNLGLNTQQVANIVSSALRGYPLRKIRTPEGERDVILSFTDTDRQTISDLMNLPIFLPSTNEPVKLSTIARYEIRRGPHAIHRENRLTSLAVTANLDKLTMNEARDRISKLMNQIDYPTGYGWSYGRSFREEDKTMNEMLFNIILALILIYLVMSSLFESVLYPTSIITSILFAVVGVYWFFFITGTGISFMAMVGILILMGIVVNNGIVLIDHVNLLRSRGLSRNKAIVQAGRDRMRPILMTAGTTVLGLVPLCFGTTQVGGEGGPAYFPMARAIVGGLTFSTVVTMLILPTIYILLDDLRNWSVRVIRMAKG